MYSLLSDGLFTFCIKPSESKQKPQLRISTSGGLSHQIRKLKLFPAMLIKLSEIAISEIGH